MSIMSNSFGLIEFEYKLTKNVSTVELIMVMGVPALRGKTKFSNRLKTIFTPQCVRTHC